MTNASELAPASTLRSVSISTRVLDCFLESDTLGPSQIARELGVAKSTAYEMLNSLTAGGLLERTDSRRYRLSLRLFDYGQLVLERLPIRRIARPELVALHEELGQVVQLGLPSRGYVVYVERFGHDPLRPQISGEWMRKVGGYASSAGRAMAAVDPEIEQATLALPLVRQTSRTTVDRERLLEVFKEARGRGWVQSVEEAAPGFTSVAAPVRNRAGRAVAAVSVVGQTPKMTGARTDHVVRSLLATVGRIGRQFDRFGSD